MQGVFTLTGGHASLRIWHFWYWYSASWSWASLPCPCTIAEYLHLLRPYFTAEHSCGIRYVTTPLDDQILKNRWKKPKWKIHFKTQKRNKKWETRRILKEKLSEAIDMVVKVGRNSCKEIGLRRFRLYNPLSLTGTVRAILVCSRGEPGV